MVATFDLEGEFYEEELLSNSDEMKGYRQECRERLKEEARRLVSRCTLIP